VARASKRRQCEEDEVFCAQWGFPYLGIQETMLGLPPAGAVTAKSDVTMPQQSEGSTAKKRQIEVEQNGREAIINSEENKNIQALLKMGFSTHDTVGELKTSLAAQGERIETVETAIKAQGDRIDLQNNKISLLEQMVQSRAGSADGSSPEGRLSGDTTAADLARRQWKPQYIELKGWVKDWRNVQLRNDQMIVYKDVSVLLKNVYAMLSPDDQSFIDADRTDRLNGGRTMYGSCRLGFKPGTDGDILWRIKKQLDMYLVPVADRTKIGEATQKVEPVPEDFLKGMSQAIPVRQLRIVVDCQPWKRPHVKTVGRFQGILKNMAGLVGKQIALKGEMGPPKSAIWVVAVDQRPILLAEYNKSAAPEHKDKWEVYPEAWNDMCRFYSAVLSLPDFKEELGRE